MKNLSSISFKLFGLLLLGVIIIGSQFYLCTYNYFEIKGIMESIQREVDILDRLKEARYQFEYARKQEKNWLLFKDMSYIKSRQRSLARVQDLVEGIKKGVSAEPELVEMVESFESNFLHYVSLGDELVDLDDIKKVAAFTEKVRTIDKAIVGTASEITNRLLEDVGKKDEKVAEVFGFYFMRSLIVATVGMILFAGVGFLWVYGIKRRLTRLTQATQKMALGTYSPQLDASSPDELGVLASNFNDMAAEIASREEKIGHITQELIQANNMLKKTMKGVKP